MDKNPSLFETLKQVLKHVRNPDELNEHPWVHSLLVEQALAENPQLRQVSPGQQLVSALAGLFPELRPAVPPRNGKRLDPRWGEFGLLAALYFTPFNHGTSYPTSLVDAWGRIDQAILYFVHGTCAGELTEEQVKAYQLVGSDLAYGSPSTLSDWHRKSLQRFAEIILNRERCLARMSTRPSVILNPEDANAFQPGRFVIMKRLIKLTITLVLLVLLGLGAHKGWKVYQSGRLLYQNVMDLREITQGPMDLNTVTAAIPRLKVLQIDLYAFEEEARPLLWLSPRLGWVPVYGDDLAALPALTEMAEHLLNASLLSIEAAQPLLEEFDAQYSARNITSLTALLLEMQPALSDARQDVDVALAARERVDAERLSPRLGSLVENVDSVLKLANESLSLVMALPTALGAENDGPKTYMLLLQNEDELRPTGGFITSIGNLVLYNGEIIRLEFESVDSNVQEDWSQPYPAAPWQLQEYMDSEVLILRDANWFTDFPTTAAWVEYLYAYTHSHSVDGIFAFDQQFLVMLLREIGPLSVEGAPYPLTDQNVVEYMRRAKAPPVGEVPSAEWNRKEFIPEIANAILTKLIDGKSHNWSGMVRVLLQALEERHLLLQFDDPVLAALTAERGWDNAVRPCKGDYLMVADTNVGFNKTNAVVDISLTYDVDLTDLTSAKSTLTLNHRNNAVKDRSCIQWQTESVPGEEWYPINECYWSYVRVYKQAGVELLEATPHAIPEEWTIQHKNVPAQVDNLEEELPDVQGFGTLLVVPGSKALSTSFEFALPDAVLSVSTVSSEYTYYLKVQKQPGTLQNSLAIRIHLPRKAVLKSVPPGAILENNHLLLETNLRADVEFEIIFTFP